jgi:hypothetical protein
VGRYPSSAVWGLSRVAQGVGVAKATIHHEGTKNTKKSEKLLNGETLLVVRSRFAVLRVLRAFVVNLFLHANALS